MYTLSHIFSTLWQVMSLCINHGPLQERKVLWPGLRAVPSYRHKHKYAESNLTTCQLSKIAIVDPPRWAMISQAKGFWLSWQYQAQIPSCVWKKLKMEKKERKSRRSQKTVPKCLSLGHGMVVAFMTSQQRWLLASDPFKIKSVRISAWIREELGKPFP